MLTTLFITAGVLVSISVYVLFRNLKNAPDGHEDADGFHIDQKSKPGSAEIKQGKSRKKIRGAVVGKAHQDAA